MWWQKVERQSFRLVLAPCGSVLLLAFVWAVLGAAPTQARPGVQETTATSTSTPTPTICPLVTREPLWVEPVPATTNQFTETIVVYLGNGEAVAVVAESGIYMQEGAFGAYTNPARLEIALHPYFTHHLTVYGQVKGFERNGCVYESYVKFTTRDRYGAPLVIRQLGAPGPACYLPLVYRAAD